MMEKLSAIGPLFRRVELVEWLSLLVLAITLLVPSWMYLVKQSTALELEDIRHHAKVAVFLQHDSSVATAEQTQEKIKALASVESVTLVMAPEALATFKAHSGFGPQLEVLGDKVLPHTLFVKPKPTRGGQNTTQLVETLEQMPNVDLVRLDSFWSEKLLGFLTIIDRLFVLSVLGVVFVFVVVVFFVTQVLLGRVRQELTLKLLLGATHQHILQGYVLQSMWLAGASALVSVLVTAALVLWLQAPLEAFARTFGLGLPLSALGMVPALALIAVAMLLAAITAWLTCKRVLYRLDHYLEQADRV